MRTRNLVLFVAVALVLTWALSVPARAQIPSVPSSGGTGTSMSNDFSFGTSGWNIAQPGGGNLGIYLDPTAGPYLKILNAPALGFTTGSYMLTEFLLVASNPLVIPPGPAWTDYHEYIVNSPGWTWIEDASNVWGFTSVPLVAGNHTIDPTKSYVDWTFNPAAAVNTTMTLTKHLYYSGAFSLAPVTIGEYPTPEPSTIVLLVVGAITAFGYGWSRRRRA